MRAPIRAVSVFLFAALPLLLSVAIDKADTRHRRLAVRREVSVDPKPQYKPQFRPDPKPELKVQPKPHVDPQAGPRPDRSPAGRAGPAAPAPPAAAPVVPPAPAPAIATDTVTGSVVEPLKIPDSALEPVRWDELDGWADDDHARALATFQASCRPIVRTKAASDMRPVRAALLAVCARAIAARRLDAAAARLFFENNFIPVRIRKLGDDAGFLTGYYEPIVDGSRFPTREFSVPLYRRPPDLVAAGATRPDGPFPNSGGALRKTADGDLRALLRSRRDRGRRARRPASGNLLAAHGDRRPVHRFRARPGSGLKTAPCCASITTRITAIPMFRSGASCSNATRSRAKKCRCSASANGWRPIRKRPKDVRRQNRSVVFFRIVALDDDHGSARRPGHSACRPAVRSPLTRHCMSTARRSSSRPTFR